MSAHWHRLRSRDTGYTLVELLVAMVIMGMLGTAILAAVRATASSARVTKTATDLNGEARGMLNRLARELREAQRIEAVSSPDGATSITFDVDFNADGTIESNNTADPEILTYCYDAPTKNVYLSTNGAACTASTALPVLSGQVTGFTLQYRSSRYAYDANSDGLTTWQELDNGTACGGSGTANGVGNRDCVLNSELAAVDSVRLAFTVAGDGRSQFYRTQVDLRNSR
jgi:prepilin-type N-terminal cleavage/methylation domain-containing protein